MAIGGGILVLLGLLGLALPFLPGTVFLIAGLLVWSSEFRWANKALVRVRRWIRNRRADGERGADQPPFPDKTVAGGEELD